MGSLPEDRPARAARAHAHAGFLARLRHSHRGAAPQGPLSSWRRRPL